MADPYIGEIRPVAFSFAPIGWAFCDGSILPIDQYAALYSLLGNTFGGDGTQTFALPDLRGRVPVGFGNDGSGSNYFLGQSFGIESVKLSTTQIPAHSHSLQAANAPANAHSPVSHLPATAFRNVYHSGTFAGGTPMVALGSSGGDQPHDNRQPYLGISFIIALEGIYPSRN